MLQYFNTLTHIFLKKSTYPVQSGSAPAEAEAKDAVTLDDLEKYFFFPAANSKWVRFLIACTKCLLNASLRKM